METEYLPFYVAVQTDDASLPTPGRISSLNQSGYCERVTLGKAKRVAQLADIFRGRIVDVAPDSVIVEVTGDGAKVDGLVDLLRPRGLLEMVRTGKVAMLRGVAPAA